MSSENKTKPQPASVKDFILKQPEKYHEDCFKLIDFFKEVTGEVPVMWGGSIVGFGQYYYKYKTGREGDMLMAGFSPRKQSLTIYVMAGFGNKEIMSRLGTYKTGKSCLYVKTLSDIDLNVLEELTVFSINHVQETYPEQSIQIKSNKRK
jgi:hypothetical protein